MVEGTQGAPVGPRRLSPSVPRVPVAARLTPSASPAVQNELLSAQPNMRRVRSRPSPCRLKGQRDGTSGAFCGQSGKGWRGDLRRENRTEVLICSPALGYSPKRRRPGPALPTQPRGLCPAGRAGHRRHARLSSEESLTVLCAFRGDRTSGNTPRCSGVGADRAHSLKGGCDGLRGAPAPRDQGVPQHPALTGGAQMGLESMRRAK